jgi:hypothetical protein
MDIAVVLASSPAAVALKSAIISRLTQALQPDRIQRIDAVESCPALK